MAENRYWLAIELLEYARHDDEADMWQHHMQTTAILRYNGMLGEAIALLEWAGREWQDE